MAKIPDFLCAGYGRRRFIGGWLRQHAEKRQRKPKPPKNYQPVERDRPVAPTIRVMGYGAPDTTSKIAAMHAAAPAGDYAPKMDAYRAMAEHVYGMSVQGGTTVRDMVVKR